MAGAETRLRLARVTDAEEVLRIYAPIVTETAISFELTVPSLKEMEERITKTITSLPWLVCEQEGEVIGYAYASRHRDRLAYQWSVDVSVYVSANARRRGVARKLYSALLAVLRAQGYYNVFAGIALPNEASIGAHEALGFRQAALYKQTGFKLGEWRDVGWWQLTLREHDANPQPPRLVPELAASGELDSLLS